MSGALQMRDKALLPTDQPVTEFVLRAVVVQVRIFHPQRSCTE